MIDCFTRIGLSCETTSKIVDKLSAAYNQPHRQYHNSEHIESCLHALEKHRYLAEQPDEIAVAIWFHDAVYDTKRNDNEANSAEWAEEELFAGGVPVDRIGRISNMIQSTAGHDAPHEFDTALMLDIDLNILGSSPDLYQTYSENIRKEYWWVVDDQYQVARVRILRTFLDREKIYTTVAYTDKEDQARINIMNEILELERES